jgi:hypothetical protein
MNMHEHDKDLIMALAEGSLDETAAGAARTEIGACAECSRDLELQQIALSVLDDLPDVYLTAAESSDLHSNLKRELKLQGPAPVPAARRFAWGRWLPAAGIAAVFLVAIISLPNMFGGGDAGDTAAMDLTTTAAASEETTAAASAPRQAVGGAADDDAMALDGAEESGEAATETTEAMAETTAADSTPTTDSSQFTAYGVLPFLGAIEDLDRPSLLEQLADEGAEVKALSAQAREADGFVDSCLETNSAPEIASRLGLPEGSEPILLGVVSDEQTGEELLLVAYVPADVAETVFVTQRGFSCDIVETLFRTG